MNVTQTHLHTTECERESEVRHKAPSMCIYFAVYTCRREESRKLDNKRTELPLQPPIGGITLQARESTSLMKEHMQSTLGGDGRLEDRSDPKAAGYADRER